MELIQKIAIEVYQAGGELWVIGGFVREHIFTKYHTDPIHLTKDIDCEVYGIDQGRFEAILARYGAVDFVGQQFGVYKLTANGKNYDFSFPRADSVGRKPTVKVDIYMDKGIACGRRNFTCNSMMLNPLDGELLDFYGGEQDIKHKQLDITNLSRFADDPLRPLNGLFLCGAYNMYPSYLTEAMCRKMVWAHETLPASRIWEEWKKWAIRSITPSKGLNYLKAIGWLANYPELEILDTVPQDPEWHPEGNVWVHTLLTVDEAAYIARHWDEDRRLVLVLAALCHDLDKATCTRYGNGAEQVGLDYLTRDYIPNGDKEKVLEYIRDGRFRLISPGHDEGIQAEKFLNRIFCPIEIKERVLALVKTHMVHIQGMRPKKLLKRLGNNRPTDWLAIVCADHSARPPLPKETPVLALFLYYEMIEQPDDAIEPIVTGKHLLALGHQAGPPMGMILRNIYELGQLEGKFNDLESGLRWAYSAGWINNPYAAGNPAYGIRPEILEAKRNK